MDESTTDSTAVDTGVTETQPVTTGDDSAVTTDESTTTTASTDEAASDDNLEWLKSKGVDPTDPEATAKIAKMYRDAEKAMHQSTQKASELQKALQPTPGEQPTAESLAADPVAALANEVQALKLTQSVTGFFSTNPDAKQYEAQMATIVTENPTVGALVKGGYLSVQNLYDMAKGADSSREGQLKKDGGREALQKVADKQQGKAVQGQATSSALSDDSKPDLFRDGLLGKT